MTVRRILVGWDGSRDGRAALRMAVHLGCELHADVVVLAVVSDPGGEEGVDPEAPSRRGNVADEIEREGKGLDVHLHSVVVAAPRPATVIGAHAAEHGFDLVVVGRHGRDRAIHPRIGGVTEHLVRHSSCPVLVVGER